MLYEFCSVPLENRATECVRSHAGMNRLMGFFQATLEVFVTATPFLPP